MVAFVRDRDIFIVDAETGDEIEVTNSGRADEAVFNGVADWVYEGMYLVGGCSFVNQNTCLNLLLQRKC